MHNLTPEEVRLLETVSTLDEAAEIAISALARMKLSHAEIVQLCGPMSSGGFDDFTKNMQRFNRCVEIAQDHGLVVFDQVIFQRTVIRILDWKEGQPYPTDLLEVFYRKIFESGHVTKGLFLPGWQRSIGAQWEWDCLHRLMIPIEEYPNDWMSEV